MSEELSKIVQTIIGSGFQIERNALVTLTRAEKSQTLPKLLQRLKDAMTAGQVPNNLITTSLLQKLVDEMQERSTPQIPVTPSRIIPAKDMESRIKIIRDPSNRSASGGGVEDFGNLFRHRFQTLSRLLRKRPDARDAVSISHVMKAAHGAKIKFVCMVTEKRERSGKLFLDVEDEEASITVLVSPEAGKEMMLRAQMVPLDQVICVKGVKGKGNLVVAEDVLLPDIPDHKPTCSEERVYAALISDLHVGSKYFMEDAFRHFLSWLKGEVGNYEQTEVALRTKYLLIGGDLVDGIGIYPRQEDQLAIKDVHDQYRAAAKLLHDIPDYIDVVLIPGNHDAVRQALPQPAISPEFAQSVYESRKIISLGNPAEISLHDVRFLLYHGRSLDDVIATLPGMSFATPEKAMELLLRCRHLAPEYGKRTTVAPEREDHMIINDVPDVFLAGHVHVLKYGDYRGTFIVNSGAWQSQTDYQRRMGLVPTPGKLVVLDLSTIEPRCISFVPE